MKILTQTGVGIQALYNRHLGFRKKHVEEKVRGIIEDVRLYGDDALLKYTRKFDKVKLTAKELRVAENEISGAFQNITSDFINDLRIILNNVTEFYKKQVPKACRVRNDDGILLKENILPLETVGIYVPAGTAPLISTVYMTAVPARVAGVKRIVIATPPDKNGNINPYILAVANLLKVNEIYKMGGAQAIAAMAFGTKTIPALTRSSAPATCSSPKPSGSCSVMSISTCWPARRNWSSSPTGTVTRTMWWRIWRRSSNTLADWPFW